MPIASIACLPRRACTMSRVYLPVRAQCTQASRPATRNPVSSNPATSLAAICSRTYSRKPSSRPAARAAGELLQDLVGGQLGVEDQQPGIGAGGGLPVVGEGDDLGGLFG